MEMCRTLWTDLNIDTDYWLKSAECDDAWSHLRIQTLHGAYSVDSIHSDHAAGGQEDQKGFGRLG